MDSLLADERHDEADREFINLRELLPEKEIKARSHDARTARTVSRRAALRRRADLWGEMYRTLTDPLNDELTNREVADGISARLAVTPDATEDDRETVDQARKMPVAYESRFAKKGMDRTDASARRIMEAQKRLGAAPAGEGTQTLIRTRIALAGVKAGGPWLGPVLTGGERKVLRETRSLAWDRARSQPGGAVVEAVVRALGFYALQGGDLKEMERLTAEAHAPETEKLGLVITNTFGFAGPESDSENIIHNIARGTGALPLTTWAGTALRSTKLAAASPSRLQKMGQEREIPQRPLAPCGCFGKNPNRLRKYFKHPTSSLPRSVMPHNRYIQLPE